MFLSTCACICVCHGKLLVTCILVTVFLRLLCNCNCVKTTLLLRADMYRIRRSGSVINSLCGGRGGEATHTHTYHWEHFIAALLWWGVSPNKIYSIPARQEHLFVRGCCSNYFVISVFTCTSQFWGSCRFISCSIRRLRGTCDTWLQIMTWWVSNRLRRGYLSWTLMVVTLPSETHQRLRTESLWFLAVWTVLLHLPVGWISS